MAKVVATKAEDEELPLFGAHDHKGEYEQPEPWDHGAFEVDERSTAERQADSIGTHRRRLEVEGYTVLPQILEQKVGLRPEDVFISVSSNTRPRTYAADAFQPAVF